MQNIEVNQTNSPTFSDEINQALLHLNDLLVTEERDQHREFVLILVPPTNSQECIHVSVGGKPLNVTHGTLYGILLAIKDYVNEVLHR